MLPRAALNLPLSRGNVAYSSPSQLMHSAEWAAAASGSRTGVCCGCEKAVGSWNLLFQDPTVSVLWRCPTLPHPPRCSTIGACGLSFQVRNGGWAFPRGYDHHKMVQPYSLKRPRVCAACWAWGFVLVVIRIVATSTFLVSVNRLWLMCLCLVSAH